MCAMAKLRTVFDSLEQVVDDGMHTQCTKFLPLRWLLLHYCVLLLAAFSAFFAFGCFFFFSFLPLYKRNGYVFFSLYKLIF